MTDAVYRALLDRLTLTAAAASALRIDRQLSEETVVRNLYASVPCVEALTRHCAALAAIFSVGGVPGFFRSDLQWKLSASEGELLIPVRDVMGHVVACQLRSDQGSQRYRWLSSKGRPSGATPGAPIHFAAPERMTSGVALITEGVLKADCIAELMRCTVVGLPGASAFTDTIAVALRSAMPALTTVKVAFDADAWTKPAVSSALARLVHYLKDAGLAVSLLRWDPTLGKGLDDVLHSHARDINSAVST